MPYEKHADYLAFQRGYYQRHKSTLRGRARLRQRLVRGTPTLWSILDNPQGFCAAMAQHAINECGGAMPPSLCKDDLQQEIAEALVRGRAASRCTNACKYAATLAIRVAKQYLRKERARGISKEDQGTPGEFSNGNGCRTPQNH